MSESIASEVVSAMVGGMFSASALYPLEVLKTRMQAETKVSAKDGEYCFVLCVCLCCVVSGGRLGIANFVHITCLIFIRPYYSLMQ